MGRRISCPVCGCRGIRMSSGDGRGGDVRWCCRECGESYRWPGKKVYPPTGMDFVTGVVILLAATCCVFGLLI
jgi:hypothetical protein